MYVFLDIDECDFPDTCNGPGINCLNTEGSYTCECQLGYVETVAGQCTGMMKSRVFRIRKYVRLKHMAE